MTPEQLRQTAAALIAAADGKKWEISRNEDFWGDPVPCSTPKDYIADGYLLRPAPEPQMRDWNCPEEFPIGAVIRHRTEPKGWYLPTSIWPDGVAVTFKGSAYFFPWEMLGAFYDYSTTRRKDDWHPCKVLVQ